MNSPQKKKKKIKTNPTPGGPCGLLGGGGGKNSKVREMSWTARESIIIFNPHPTLWLGVLGLNISKREGERKEGRRAEEGRSKGAGR